jgi:hypothetical protein
MPNMTDMGIDATALIGGALGGAAVQSVLEPLIGQRHLRRDLRSNVLQAITEVEGNRWAPHDRDDFRRSASELRSAVLVAGLPRQPAEFYIKAASAGRMLSERDWEETGGGDEEVPGGAIPSELNHLIQGAAAQLVASAWHPYRTRPLARHKRKRLQAEKQATTEALSDDPRSRFQWDHVWVPQ